MDQVTQQNAAMVEQSTAASRSLADKTRALQDLIRFFDVGETPAAAPRRDMSRPAAKAPREVSQSRPTARRQGAAVAVKVLPQNDWAEF
jgi:methyl-accepting chemotaxis protein